MKIISRSLILGLFTIILSACGGGGSDSGGGAANASYSGTSNLTLSAPGVAPQTSQVGITVTVADGKVTVSDGTDSGTAALNSDGKSYSVPIRLIVVNSGVTCDGNIIFTGTLEGSKTSGTISGGTPCRGAASFTITASGNFTANKTSKAFTTGTSLSETMADVAQQANNN